MASAIQPPKPPSIDSENIKKEWNKFIGEFYKYAGEKKSVID
jgi:hypothetical protein